jgi:alpha-2-macroglobulin-like protein
VRQLLDERVGRRWLTARASAAAFSTLLDYALDSGDGKNNAQALRLNDDVPAPPPPGRPAVGGYSYKLYLNDALLTEVDVDPSNPSAAHRLIVLPVDKLQPQNVIKLVGSGGTPLYYAITIHYRRSINASFTASDDDAARFSLQNPRALPSNSSNGLSISRSYENLTHPTAPDLRIGDTVRVTLKVAAPPDNTTMSQMLVNDQLPAGFVVIGPEQPSLPRRTMLGRDIPDGDQEDGEATISQYASFTTDANGVSFLVDTMTPGATYTFSYLAQVTVSGDFAAPPSTVYPLYQPDKVASSASNLISVANDKGQ